MIDLDFKYKELIEYIHREAPFKPELALILGSGLGDFINSINKIKTIATKAIPGYPESTVEGHKGFLHFADHHNKKVLIFQGRIHFYEGYTIDQCIMPALISEKLNVESMIITNAAGGINLNFSPGDLMLVQDFLSHNISKELSQLFKISTVDEREFLRNLPSRNLNNIIREAALKEKIVMKEGVYWYGKGPSYETPSEVRMQARFGADAVGMSTVHEALFAAIRGVQVSSISLITNYAAGITSIPLSHTEVIETAELAKEKFQKLIIKTVELL